MTSTVTLLTQHDCTLCEHAKQVLTRVGRDHRLDVQEISLDTPAGKELAVRHSVLFSPRERARRMKRTVSTSDS